MRHLPQRVFAWLLNIERLPKAQITHDIKHKIVHFLTKVYGSRPLRRAVMLIEQDLVPTLDMLTNKGRDSIHRTISEASIEHLASYGVFRRVYGVQGCFFPDVLGQSHIEGTSSNIGLHTIDGGMGLWVTEQHQIWCDTDSLTIDLEQLP